MEVDDEPLTFRDCYHYKENDMAGMSGRQPLDSLFLRKVYLRNERRESVYHEIPG